MLGSGREAKRCTWVLSWLGAEWSREGVIEAGVLDASLRCRSCELLEGDEGLQVVVDLR